MTWLTWRLHRTEAVIGVVLLSGLMLTMFFAIRSVDAAYQAALDLNCFQSGSNPLCSVRINAYFDRSGSWRNLTTLLHGVPIVAAALLAIPLIQELERGTHRLAWTQSISRERWSLVRLGFAAGVAALVGVVWAARADGWRTSIVRADGSDFYRDAFELSPAVLIGYVLFALAIALAAGVILRRIVPAVILLALGFTGTRIFTTFYLRERYRDPIVEIIPGASDEGAYSVDPHRWIIDQSWITGSGERISWERVNQLCLVAYDGQAAETAYRQCLTDNNISYYRAFHPIDRFGQFQAIETAIYLGLAAGLIVLAFWWLTRRPA